MNAAEIARNNWDSNTNDCQARFRVWPVYSAYVDSMVKAGRGSELLNEQPPDPQPLRITEPVALSPFEGVTDDQLKRIAARQQEQLEALVHQIDAGGFA